MRIGPQALYVSLSSMHNPERYKAAMMQKVEYMLVRVDHMPVVAYEGENEMVAGHWYASIKKYTGLKYVTWTTNGDIRKHFNGSPPP